MSSGVGINAGRSSSVKRAPTSEQGGMDAPPLEVPFAPSSRTEPSPTIGHGGNASVSRVAALRSGQLEMGAREAVAEAPFAVPGMACLAGISAHARELGELSATETAALLARGELSRSEVIEAAIERARISQPVIHAMASELFERARDHRPRPGAPLDGVPTAIKDIVPVGGLITTYGSKATPRTPAVESSHAVRDFEGLGGVAIARSTSSEFGYTSTVEPPGHPPTRNPYDLTRSSGGSSGGAAALVAAGVVSFAHTTDGGGSTRIPANWCGLYGMKPTRGRQTSLASAQKMPVEINAAGAVTRTVEDLATVMNGLDRGAVNGLPPLGFVEGPGREKLRVGFYIDPLNGKTDPEVAATVRRTARELEKQGHIVEEIAPPYDEQFVEDFLQHYALIAAVTEFKLWRAGADLDDLEPFSRGLAAMARKPWNLLRMPFNVRRLGRYHEEYAKNFERRDIILSPTTTTTAPKIGFLSPSLDFETHLRRLMDTVAFTPLQNGSGGPALTVPAGLSRDGLPIGVQLASGMGQERRLIELAYALADQ